MLKPVAAAFAVSTLLATASFAEEATSIRECLDRAEALANATESKPMSEDKGDRLDQLLTDLEWHCEEGRFPQAAAVSKEIEAEFGQ